ncbi:TolA-binding protein [Lachnotalea glycerini]|uniref:TolA-binding protein n=1 Tax=Lachnotalea glycerini TaxID=1763509 RepID=A0A318EJD9_9FIRM|nr:tetratricopeptide repeat protein [Lachnotalea glycerini]PXV85978.1 TolA-binding protein [Lachnotalea glycerini]
MKCFKCGCELSDKDFCTSCGEDVRVFKKIIKISNMHYNDGLAKADVRDLSGAVISLRQSLKLNKNNTQARNLLGLVYYEMGEVVGALSEWVISKNLESSKNIAGDYIRAIQSNPNRLETINQTIKKYNQALLYCKQESEDLAIIQLKKVLSLNPNLVAGHQLIALLYMKHDEYEKAGRELKKALKIDTTNTTTLRYMREIELMVEKPVVNNAQKAKQREERISYTSGNETIIQPTVYKENNGISTVINVIIGLAIGAALTAFLILPAKIQSMQSEAQQSVIDYSNQISAKTATITDLQAQLDTANSQLDEKSKELEQYVGDTGVVEVYQKLLIAQKAYNDNDKLTAYDALSGIDSSALKDESLSIYESLYSNVSTTAATTFYDAGKKAYQSGDYDTAIENLLKVVQMDETNGNALYILARSYQKNGDQETANQYFEQVIEKFPNTEMAANAKINKH